MTEYSRIVLASHGTPGGQAAERAALALCARGASLRQLVVVPDFWRGMMGDDWLNNASTRETYGRHVEHQIEAEIAVQVARVRTKATQLGLNYQCRTVLGKPAECLLAYSLEFAPELVVIGAPRPKGTTGLRSRMHLETLVRALGARLLIVPHP
ncbi:MAG: universal stress protein [Betaproteobacteria bacterium]|nr:MAG: universal stress protein [Betaproteobacteria bacterium]